MLKLFGGFRKKPSVRTTRRIFDAVSIKAKLNPCDAAAILQCERFLVDEAPPLPLSVCTHPHACECEYEHFDDRRTAKRRTWDQGSPPVQFNDDIRHGVGRRVTDG
ncbi:MAG: hypothetical protein O7F71_13485 [Gammaproteobacteria bacterium]|nr:hypothetical protein [Gammaproteobacteria bacterium]